MNFFINSTNQTRDQIGLINSISKNYCFVISKGIRISSITLAFALIFSNLQGCASLSDRQQTEGEGTAAGAIMGGVLGKLFGGDDKSMVAGAMVGAVVGNLYGKHVADKKAEYESTESYMEAMIAESDKVISEAKNQRNALTANIEQQKQELARLYSVQLKDRVNKEKIELQITKNEQDLKATGELIAKIDREIQIQKRVVNQERNEAVAVFVSRSETNISAMDSEKRQLQILKAQLASLDYRRVY